MAIGEALAAARESRGLTVDDVAQATWIRATLVRAIERDDFSLCGGSVYARGHIRSIARRVGLDPEPLIAEYDAEHGTAPTVPTAELFEADSARALVPERKGPRWGSAMLIAVLLAVSVIAGASILGSRHGGPPQAAADRTQTSTSAAKPTTSAKPATPTRTRTTPPSIALNHRDGVSVRLRVVGDRSWVSAADSSGRTVFQGLLARGQVKDFLDPKEIRLTIGAAQAVDLVVNGKDIGLAGPAGPVAHVVFHPGDPAASGSRG